MAKKVTTVKCCVCGATRDREEMWNLDDYCRDLWRAGVSADAVPSGSFACAGAHSCGMSLFEQVIGGPLPIPTTRDGRICFGIALFANEADADRYAKWVRLMGHTYNGGYQHGQSCGREPEHDRVDPELGQLFAVTTR